MLRTEAQVLVYRNDLAAASSLFRESQRFAHEHHDTFLEATDLLNLGLVALEMGRYDEALASLSGAADFARTAQARQVVEAAFGNLGVAYFYLGDFQKALLNFEQAEVQAKEIGTTSAQGSWLWDAGASYYQLGNLAQAKDCFEEALKIAQSIHAPDEIAGISAQLAFLFYQEGRFDLARAQAEQALDAARAAGDKSAELEPHFLEARLAARQANRQDAEQMLIQVEKESAERPALQWEVENALADFYSEKGEGIRAERWYRRSIQTFEDQRASVKDEELKLPFFANGDALYRDYAYFLIASHRPDEALRLLDLGRARTLEEGLGLAENNPHSSQTKTDPRAVAAKLNAAILFYSLGPDKSYLWAITGRQTALFTLPRQSEIESLVQRYQKDILRSGDPLHDSDESGKLLYDTLIAPAASMLSKGSRVFVIPDGGLNNLNFETLLAPGPDDLHYWIEDVTVTNTNSIRLLARPDAPRNVADPKNLLLIGNPISPAKEYEDLPNAAAEISGVEKHFAPLRQRTLTQAQAVPAAYSANQPGRFAYIHFVAHGTASRLSPLDSAVVLSATPGHPEDFKLYARDIVRTPVHAQLVTISACYGSGLRAYAGEGLVGLSWAFLRAGAHNVIGALWEVNDASTPLLMDRLYSELAAGSRPDAALRAAKLRLIHSSGVYRKPLYWAAFQIYAGTTS
ncbi:CHAT domain-containing protein [Silvibacterium bohemicum]|uniref:CHAT domain-containing protein n=1 Tax=Silvibacterium bohemicum TaxID=1577686 RepID=A0A841JNB2_9BACT|nr:CHAT domain-containing protein [Silvibacterium bohemicum]MBB6142846.1 CHAT domain-containing protein [Silvibacterium bohemicum]